MGSKEIQRALMKVKRSRLNIDHAQDTLKTYN